MKFLSLFSGIEACSVAWKPLGWECIGFIEIEPYPCSLLASHYPSVPNLGDITKITEQQVAALGEFDVLVFGSPCQDLSAAGTRKGFQDGTRSNLFYEALRIFDYARQHNGCRFALWENVPGAFSSNKGADFTAVVREMAGLIDLDTPKNGWGNTGAAVGENGLLEWRVLDAQYFRLAQRRKRVFAILDTGDWGNRPPILFEQESLRGDTPPSREKGSYITNTTTARLASGGNVVDTLEPKAVSEQGLSDTTGTITASYGQDGADLATKPLVAYPINTMTAHGRPSDTGRMGLGLGSDTDPSPTITSNHSHAVAIAVHGTQDPVSNIELAQTLGCNSGQENAIAYTIHADPTPKISTGVAGTLRSQGGGGIVPPTVVLPTLGFDPRFYNSDDELSPTLKASDYKDPKCVYWRYVVRRLTPTECERLMGFPDGYTAITHNGKPASNSARYKALGNSMATNVMQYIGKQIERAVYFSQENATMKYPKKGAFFPTQIQTFFTCPYQYYAKYITKEVKFQSNIHAQFGTAVHKNIEDYLTGVGELSPFLEPLRTTLDNIKKVMLVAEGKFHITKWNTKVKSAYDTDAFLGCIVDCVIASQDGKIIIAFDWKTGKKSDAQVQHDIIKRCLQVAYPKAEKIITVFWYFIKGAVDIQHHKPNAPLVDLDDKIAKVEKAHKTGEFPYNPNGLCKQWCDVLSCPHNGRTS